MKIEMEGVRLGRGKNNREHYMVRHKRVRGEKEAMAWHLTSVKQRPELPCTFVLTRCAPSKGLDDDNLVESLAAIRDAIAEWMKIDDRHSNLVRYVYEQNKKPWGVIVESRDGIG